MSIGDLADTFAGQVRQREADPLTMTESLPSAPPVKVVLDGGRLVNWLAAVPQPVIADYLDSLGYRGAGPGNPTQIANSRAFSRTRQG